MGMGVGSHQEVWRRKEVFVFQITCTQDTLLTSFEATLHYSYP